MLVTGEHVDAALPAPRPAGACGVQNRSRRFCKPLSRLSESIRQDVSDSSSSPLTRIVGGLSRQPSRWLPPGLGDASGIASSL